MEKTLLKNGGGKGKVLTGTVVSTKMKDTIVVSVRRFVQHPKYKKYVKIEKRYKAHDSSGACQIGDVVYIKESRPISKDKHFVLEGIRSSSKGVNEDVENTETNN